MNSNLGLTLKNRLSNIKLLPLLVGTMSLAVSAAIIPAVFAQSNTPTAPKERHQQNWLNLTPEQQEQMRQIKQSEREQMDNILTAEQKARLEAAKGNRENRRQVWESLNLTDEQKAQIQEVRRVSKEQKDAILPQNSVSKCSNTVNPAKKDLKPRSRRVAPDAIARSQVASGVLQIVEGTIVLPKAVSCFHHHLIQDIAVAKAVRTNRQ
jgi:Spy/CpxP family protein refolding chaperone